MSDEITGDITIEGRIVNVEDGVLAMRHAATPWPFDQTMKPNAQKENALAHVVRIDGTRGIADGQFVSARIFTDDELRGMMKPPPARGQGQWPDGLHAAVAGATRKGSPVLLGDLPA